MGILSKIFGSSKIVEKGLDLTDKAFYTKQEQAETDLEVKKLVTASKGSSLAIRIGFWMTLGTYILAFSISELCILFGSNELAVNISYLITTYNLYPMTLSFVSFYTGKKIIGGFNANKTMEKLTDFEQAKKEPKKDNVFYRKLKEQLTKHEGLRLEPYRCSANKLSIGIGRNLDDVGIFEDEARYLLENDIKRCEKDLDRNVAWWRDKGENIRLVLIDMCFNLGIAGLLKFEKFLSALERGDYKKASAEMLDSAWAKQVGVRAKNLQELVLA